MIHGSAEQGVSEALAALLPEVAAQGGWSFWPLAGGLNTRSFVVAAGGRQFVLRLPIEGAPPLLDLAAEVQVMRAAAAAGLAPAVTGAQVERGWLLTEYRAGAASWTPAEARESRNIVRAAALLRTLHAVPAPAAPRFAAEAIAERYVAAAGPGGAADPEWAPELLRRARDFDARHPGNALCHNDLFAANLLDDGELMLVDFEYAVRAAPLLDLASYAAMNDLDATQRGELVAAYYRESAPPAASALDGAVRMVRLMAYFWALLVRDGAPSAGAYAGLREHMARMLNGDRV